MKDIYCEETRRRRCAGYKGPKGGDIDALTEKLKIRSGLGDISLCERILQKLYRTA
jgi:hypothetical protein